MNERGEKEKKKKKDEGGEGREQLLNPPHARARVCTQYAHEKEKGKKGKKKKKRERKQKKEQQAKLLLRALSNARFLLGFNFSRVPDYI